jgi:hypothetical protein
MGITRSRQRHGKPDRFAPVGFAPHFRPAVAVHARENIVQTRFRIFRARVVGRCDGDVGKVFAMRPIFGRFVLSRSPPHPNTEIKRPLVSGRADLENVVQTVWRVCVCPRARRTPARLHRLESAGDRRTGTQTFRDYLRGQAPRDTVPNSGEGVVNVKASAEWEFNR